MLIRKMFYVSSVLFVLIMLSGTFRAVPTPPSLMFERIINQLKLDAKTMDQYITDLANEPNVSIPEQISKLKQSLKAIDTILTIRLTPLVATDTFVWSRPGSPQLERLARMSLGRGNWEVSPQVEKDQKKFLQEAARELSNLSDTLKKIMATGSFKDDPVFAIRRSTVGVLEAHLKRSQALVAEAHNLLNKLVHPEIPLHLELPQYN